MTLLERLGVEVAFPRAQTCCGQLHLNAGYPDVAAALARRFVEVFAGFDAIVAPSGSCVAHVRSHVREHAADPDDVAGADVRALGVPRRPPGSHGRRLRLSRARSRTTPRVTRCGCSSSVTVPVSLLRAVPGVELVALPDATECCGFGGTFAVQNADVSSAMLEDKLDSIARSGAAAVCACDASCLLHIRGGLERRAQPGAARSISQRCSRREHAREPRGGADDVRARGARDPDERAGSRERAARNDVDSRQAGAGVAEMPDWEELRRAGEAIKEHALLRLDELLVRLESEVSRARRRGALGGRRRRGERDRDAHRARPGARRGREGEVAHDRRDRPERGARGAGIQPIETDLAELIVQLAGERPSHLLVPAIHRTGREIGDLFRERLGPDVSPTTPAS